MWLLAEGTPPKKQILNIMTNYEITKKKPSARQIANYKKKSHMTDHKTCNCLTVNGKVEN